MREQIAVVSQDVVLFNDTIRNNIAFGREVSAEAIEAAAEAAHVMEFVREQPARTRHDGRVIGAYCSQVANGSVSLLHARF